MNSPGVLPRVIKTILERRNAVKKELKRAKEGTTMHQQLDIRQLALKLTANSMYGCLGFTFSRFYAKPLAQLITSQGRQLLQRSKEITVRLERLRAAQNGSRPGPELLQSACRRRRSGSRSSTATRTPSWSTRGPATTMRRWSRPRM
jgi:hypothetical protein